MQFKSYIFFLLLFPVAWCANAQSDEDTTRIMRFKRLHTIQLSTWVTDVDLVVNPRKTERDYTIRLQPNIKGQAGIGLGFKKFAIALGFQVAGTQGDESVYGSTRYYDFSFGYFQRKFGGEVYYRYFQGMYSNPNDFASQSIRPDIYLSNGGVNFFYAQNHKRFSMRSAISQQERQLYPAGSFILLCNVQFRTLRADSSIIPAIIDNAETFPALSGLQQMRFITFNLKPGYAHNFVGPKGHWFFCPSFYAGLGTGWYTTQSNRGYRSGIPLDLSFHSKVTGGYNHDRWYLGIFYYYDGSVNAFKSSYINLNTHSVGINLGYRLSNMGIKLKWL